MLFGFLVDRFGQVLADLVLVDVEGGRRTRVADVVTAQVDVHETRDEVGLRGVLVVVAALDEAARAVPRRRWRRGSSCSSRGCGPAPGRSRRRCWSCRSLCSWLLFAKLRTDVPSALDSGHASQNNAPLYKGSLMLGRPPPPVKAERTRRPIREAGPLGRGGRVGPAGAPDLGAADERPGACAAGSRGSTARRRRWRRATSASSPKSSHGVKGQPSRATQPDQAALGEDQVRVGGRVSIGVAVADEGHAPAGGLVRQDALALARSADQAVGMAVGKSHRRARCRRRWSRC